MTVKKYQKGLLSSLSISHFLMHSCTLPDWSRDWIKGSGKDQYTTAAAKASQHTNIKFLEIYKYQEKKNQQIFNLIVNPN